MELAPRPLRELLRVLPQATVDGSPELWVRGMTHDSRQVGPGFLFVAYQGVQQDVHAYLPDAVRHGAVAALVERPARQLRSELGLPKEVTLIQVPDARHARALVAAEWCGRPSADLTVIGVTGTDGKTTTSTLIYAILNASGRRAGLISTVAARIGDREQPTGAHTTTPEAEDVQALLAEMRAQGLDSVVLEATSHGLAQSRLDSIEFDVAAITNITHNEALEFHGTFERYREAKALLFRSLVAPSVKVAIPKTAVLNAADPSFAYLQAIGAPRQITYSVDGDADFQAREVHHSAAGLRFTAVTPLGPLAITSPLLGRYNVANILAAMASAYALGVPVEGWLAGIQSVAAIPGRMERIHAGQPFLAIVDFAHTPNALASALATARELAGRGRVIVVFGCAGLRYAGKRPAMGSIAGRLADVTFVTAEDPRTEDLDRILDAIAAGLLAVGGIEGQTFYRVPDRFEAIRQACSLARPGDVVLVCGKGHEPTMCFGDTEYPWDDRAAVQAALEGRVYGALPTAVR